MELGGPLHQNLLNRLRKPIGKSSGFCLMIYTELHYKKTLKILICLTGLCQLPCLKKKMSALMEANYHRRNN